MSRCICAGVNWNWLASAMARRSDSAREYLMQSSARGFVRSVDSAAGMSWRNKWRALVSARCVASTIWSSVGACNAEFRPCTPITICGTASLRSGVGRRVVQGGLIGYRSRYVARGILRAAVSCSSRYPANWGEGASGVRFPRVS